MSMNPSPKCIIVTGRPGSGKTTLSKKLAERLYLPLISRDAIKEGYVNSYGIKHNQLPSDTNEHVSKFFFEMVVQHLAANVSVVIEAAFQHKLWSENIDPIKQLSELFVVICKVDEQLAAQRHLQRGLDDPRREFFHGDQQVTIYKETGVMAPPEVYSVLHLDAPTIEVSTEREYSPSLDDLLNFLQSPSTQ